MFSIFFVQRSSLRNEAVFFASVLAGAAPVYFLRNIITWSTGKTVLATEPASAVYSIFIKIRLDVALANLTRENKLQNKFGYEIYSSYICIEQKTHSNMEKEIQNILSGYKRIGATKVSMFGPTSVTINAPEATNEIMGLASTKILNKYPEMEIIYWTGHFQTWVCTRRTLRYAGYNVK